MGVEGRERREEGKIWRTQREEMRRDEKKRKMEKKITRFRINAVGK